MRPPLPDPLPESPLLLVEQWIEEAAATVETASAMTLATVDPDGQPSARMVICRGFDSREGWFVFYSDSTSRKGQALTAHPRAALVFYWARLERQIRVEGPVTLAPDDQVDAYWNSRPLDARIAAIASDQSQPIESRAALQSKVEGAAQWLGGAAPRPARWIGYRVWAEEVELWVGQPARVHDRARWTRSLGAPGREAARDQWQMTRLQP